MIHFYRLSGGGNDFLALVEPEREPLPEEIQALCRRGLSAGADGLMVLRRHPPQAVVMEYYNADGHPAELCVNATRCAVRLARHLDWGEETLEIETGAGTLRGRVLGSGEIALEIARPKAPRAMELLHDGKVYLGWQVPVGVPHFVLPWSESLAGAPVETLGPRLRHHSAWGDRGSNVDFVRFVEPHRLEIRTFERGVEAETLACGSGVIASVAAGIADQALELPVRAQTLGGFELVVDSSASAEKWSLSGDARLIAEGTLHPGSLQVPEPANWTP